MKLETTKKIKSTVQPHELICGIIKSYCCLLGVINVVPHKGIKEPDLFSSTSP